MLIDTHAHVNFSAYKDDYADVIKRSLSQGVSLINVGSQFSTSERAVKLAKSYETGACPHTNFSKCKSNSTDNKIGVGVYAAVGLHPIHLTQQKWLEKVDEDEEFEFQTKAEKYDSQKYRALAESKKVVAIGEIGLDYFHEKDEKNIKLQKEVFREQINLAVDLDLPIMIHCREAYRDVLEILSEEKNKHEQKLRGVLHSYLGRLSHAKVFVELGFLLGFNGIITFARDYDKVIKEIGLEHMLVETDCPYLTPVPFRGKRNEPSYVKFVAEKIAQIKEISFEDVEKATSENARDLFNL